MKTIKILLAVAAVVLAGCRAQGEAPSVAPAAAGTPPQAMADIVVVEINSLNNPIAALGNDIDLSGTGLTITGVAVSQVLPPTAGATATTDGNTVTFTPPPNFTGVATLPYAIADGTGAVSSALIAVSVLPVALPPVALPDVATVAQDAGPTDVDVLVNDVDFAGGGLQVTAVSIAASVPPGANAVAIAGNQVRFTPAAGYIGAVVVGYTVADVNGATAEGVLTVVVSPLVLPSGPVPVPDAVVVAQDAPATAIDVLANDIDPAGAGLTLSNVTVTSSLPAAAHAVTVAANQVQFTPAAGFAGAVVATYTATDGDGNSADGVLTVVVSPLALTLGPVPLPDAAVVAQDSVATSVDVLANDVDLAGGGLTVTGAAVTASTDPAAVHTVAVNANQVQFTPAAGFAGVVVVTYTATDADGNSADGLLNVVVSPAALPVGLVAIPDVAIVAQDSVNNLVDVLANDVDFAGGGLTVSTVSAFSSLPAAVHTVAISANQVQFSPAPGFAGVVVVSYTATDVNGLTSIGLLNIEVTPAALALPPVALPDAGVASSLLGAAQSYDVLLNDIDPAGGGLTLTATSITTELPAGAGSVAIVGNQVQFTPTASYIGTVVISYTATDANGNSANGQLTLAVAL